MRRAGVTFSWKKQHMESRERVMGSDPNLEIIFRTRQREQFKEVGARPVMSVPLTNRLAGAPANKRGLPKIGVRARSALLITVVRWQVYGNEDARPGPGVEWNFDEMGLQQRARTCSRRVRLSQQARRCLYMHVITRTLGSTHTATLPIASTH